MLTAFKGLARLKGLRGTVFDVLGYSDVRRAERALITIYRASIEALLGRLTAANHAEALEVARVPALIKGYGHVKARQLVEACAQWAVREAAFDAACHAPATHHHLPTVRPDAGTTALCN